jgi:hypothetical protein
MSLLQTVACLLLLCTTAASSAAKTLQRPCPPSAAAAADASLARLHQAYLCCAVQVCHWHSQGPNQAGFGYNSQLDVHAVVALHMNGKDTCVMF